MIAIHHTDYTIHTNTEAELPELMEIKHLSIVFTVIS